LPMPLTVFNAEGVPANQRESIECAVVAGGKHLSVSYEAWIAADPFRGGLRVLITGPQGCERVVQFDAAEQPAEITRRVREQPSSIGTGKRDSVPSSLDAKRLPTHERHVHQGGVLADQEAHCVESLVE